MRRISLPTLARPLSCLVACPSSTDADAHEPGLDAYYAAGGNGLFLHGEGGETHSRRAAGRWLADHHLRDDFIISTVICHDDWDDARSQPIDRFTAHAVVEDIAADLDLIATDHLDLVVLGDSAPRPFEPVLEAIAQQINAGRVHGWVLSNWTPARLTAALAYAKQLNIPPTAVRTTELSLAVPECPLWPEYVPFPDLEPLVRQHNLCVLAHLDDHNLGQVLFGDADDIATRRPEWIARWNPTRNAAHVQRTIAFAAAHHLTPRQVAVAALLSHPFPVVGLVPLPSLLTARGRDDLHAATLTLTPHDLAHLRTP